MENQRLIVELASEGGGVQVFCREGCGRQFCVVLAGAARELGDGDAGPVTGRYEWRGSLASALEDVPWRWNQFAPVWVEAEFGPELLAVKRAKDGATRASGRRAQEWERACGS